VSELLTVPERFLGIRRFILRVKEPLFSPGIPTRVDERDRTASTPLEECNGEVVQPCTCWQEGGYTPYWEAGGRHIYTVILPYPP